MNQAVGNKQFKVHLHLLINITLYTGNRTLLPWKLTWLIQTMKTNSELMAHKQQSNSH